MQRGFFTFLLIIWCSVSFGETLPVGVGAVQTGGRSFVPKTAYYDGDGEKVSLGQKFYKAFTGPRLLQGEGGADLQRLATELQKYDGGRQGDEALLNRLDLGTLQADVTAHAQAQFVGVAFGVHPNLTAFVAVPWIDAQVDTDLYLAGRNNAGDIRSELGELAFQELRDGLNQASQLSVQQIKDNIEAKQYESVDTWKYRGPGDVRLGVRGSVSQYPHPKVRHSVDPYLIYSHPTGYVEQPERLTDATLDRGYSFFSVGVDERVRFARRVFVGHDSSYGMGLSRQVEKRVPVADESLMDPSRQTKVRWNPGSEYRMAPYLGVGNGFVESFYRIGTVRHFADSYQGSLPGNYSALAEDSDSSLIYHQMGISFSTVEMYQRKEFAVPLIFAVLGHASLEGRHVNEERYLEASLTSFFSTPAARR